MEIKRIKMENIGGINSADVCPQKINVLVGKNGAGKTSFLKGLKYGLAGGVGIKGDILKRDATEGIVHIETNKFDVDRITGSTNKVKVNGKTTTGKSLTELISESCGGVSQDIVKFMSSSEVFENFTSGQFTEFLLKSGIVPVEFDVDKFLNVAATTTAINADVEKRIRSLMPAAPAMMTLDTVATVNKDVSSNLKLAKKQIQKLETFVQDKVDKPTRSLEDIDKILTKYLKEEADAATAVKWQTKAKELEKQIKELEAQINADKSKKPLPAIKDECEKKIQALNNLILQYSENIAKFKANNEIHMKNIARMEKGVCPFAPTKECEQNSELKAELNSMISNNQGSIEMLSMEIEGYRKELAENQAKLNDYANAEKTYQHKIQMITQLDSLRKALAGLPVVTAIKPVDHTAEKNKLAEERNNIIRYNDYKKNLEELEKWKNESSILTVIEQITSKTGAVKSAILQLLLSALIGDINALAAKICSKLSLNLVTTKGNAQILCKVNGKEERPYEELSTGEQLIVQFLIMTEIGQLSGFKIVVMDNLDKLDSENFANFVKFLKDSDDELYDHVFLATVDHDDVINNISTIGGINMIKF